MENLIRIVIVGGGPAGLSAISAMRQWDRRDKLQITLLEPSDWHYYQSSWLPYSTNSSRNSHFRRHIAELVSSDEVNWINEAAGEFHPQNHFLLTVNGSRVDYDYLVLACGLNADWDAIKGIHGKLGRDGMTSILSYPTLDWTKKAFNSFKKGRAIFTHSNSIHNSDGPAQEMAFLLQDKLISAGDREQADIRYYTGGDKVFPVKVCDTLLRRHMGKKNIRHGLGKELVEVRPKAREAIFYDSVQNDVMVEKYDLLHVVPPMRPPIAISTSELADAAGLADVDPYSLQHKKFTNVFALGDITNSPIVRNASAIRYQMPVVVSNIAAAILGTSGQRKYDGSTHHMILISKDRGLWFKLRFEELKTSPFLYGQPKEGVFVAAIKRRLSPFIYWRILLAGRRFPAFFPQSHLSQF